MWKLSRYKANDKVVVRSKEEILATLDENGCIDNMPFMPEMLQFCGKELPVWAVAHKTCDTVNKTGGRSLDRTVHLRDSLCDGSAHGGCEAECNLFWNDAWLKPASGPAPPLQRRAGITEQRLMELTQSRQKGANGAIRYVCQATQIPESTRLLPWWNVRQYWIDIRTRNYPIGFVLRTLLLAATRQLTKMPIGYRVFRGISDLTHRVFTGKPTPRAVGAIPAGQKTPLQQLDLQPGEWVRIKPAAEIAATLNVNNKNRGMWFDYGQVPNCGRTFKVHRRVSRIIDERTGEMLTMQTPCITLHGTLCNPEFAEDRLLCPRNITAYWREIWLERTAPPQGQQR
jgi:hypothetical protein